MTAKSDSVSQKPAKKSTEKVKAPKVAPKKDETKNELIGPNEVFTLTVPRTALDASRQRVLQKAQQQVKIDGFRQGKTPLKIVEQRLGEGKILELMADDVLSPAYNQALQEKKLQPLSEPEVKPLKMEVTGDWEFEITVAVLPEIDTQKTASHIEELKRKNELWTKEPKEDTDVRQERLQVILTTLLEKIKVQVPELLLRKETERQLHELSHQLEHLNLTVADYLKKIDKSIEEVQQEYAARALSTLQVEIFLANYIREQKIETTPQEVERILTAKYAESTKKPEISRQEIEYVHATLLKQKAIDSLLTI